MIYDLHRLQKDSRLAQKVDYPAFSGTGAPPATTNGASVSTVLSGVSTVCSCYVCVSPLVGHDSHIECDQPFTPVVS